MNKAMTLIGDVLTNWRVFVRKPQHIIAGIAISGLLIDLLIKPISNAGLVLIVLALSPWIARIIESIELPGGGKVKFVQELEKATDKAAEAGLLGEPSNEIAKKAAYEIVFNHDPTLALAGLRIELEKRVRRLVEINDLYSGTGTGLPMPLTRAVSLLGDGGVLTPAELSAIRDLLPLLNRATHSQEYSRAAAEWAIEVGPRLLGGLDGKMGQR